MLDLNKKTVAHLSNQEMLKVNGGLCIKSTKRQCTWTLEIGGGGNDFDPDFWAEDGTTYA